jgi:phosphoribosylaminoimidazolecarboxamide formyltransferase/IMP cyclohydrolase
MDEKYALLSVSSKEGITEFAQDLVDQGYTIVSTSRTFEAIKEADVPVIQISELTGFPEVFDGRVKTLHPLVHGGILYERDNPEHIEQAQANGIKPIDIVAVNFYPFEEAARNPDATLDELIEKRDIGGPTMTKSAAKNFKHVLVATNPAQYPAIVNALKEDEISMDLRMQLAMEAQHAITQYETFVSQTLTPHFGGEPVVTFHLTNPVQLRYGENPHQTPAYIYKDPSFQGVSVAHAKQINGKPMSYNNYVDANSALESILEFAGQTLVAVIKHNNSRGEATGPNGRIAFLKAWYGNNVDSFGGVVASTIPVDADMMKATRGKYMEAIVAPSFTEEALDVLEKTKEKEEKKGKSTKWKDCRLLEVGNLEDATHPMRYRHIRGGILAQPANTDLFGPGVTIEDLEHTTSHEPTVPLGLFEFTYRSLRHLISNKAVVARSYEIDGEEFYQMVGVGTGQGARVDTVKLACQNARGFYEREAIKKEITPVDDYINENMSTCVLATAAFYPKFDGPETAYKAGIKNLIQPYGSKEDDNVIAFGEGHNLAMLRAPLRFFNH